MRLKTARGFTIVELLIVVVVIAILAAITIVAYNGIASRARDAQLKSDIDSAAKQLAIYNVKNGTYPTVQASDAGVMDSADTKFTYTYNPGDNTYCLVATNNGLTYSIAANQTTPGQYSCVSSFAGSPSGTAGYLDATGISALFRSPGFLTLGADNSLYVKDGTGFPTYIRKINPTTAAVSTVYSTSTVQLQTMAVKSDGTIYATSVYPMCVNKIVTGTLSTLGSCGIMQYPAGITIGTDGNLYVVDSDNNTIDKVNPANGAVTVLAGTSSGGFADATGTSAKFNAPWGITTGSDGNLYVADSGNNRIRKITLAGVVTTAAGTGGAGYVDGAIAQAQINQPVNISGDASGILYFNDSDGRVRKLSSGTVSTLAGGQTFAGGSGVSTSPTTAGVVYLDSYTGNIIYKMQ